MSKVGELREEEAQRICRLYAAGKLSHEEADSMLWMKGYPSCEREEMMNAAARQRIEARNAMVAKTIADSAIPEHIAALLSHEQTTELIGSIEVAASTALAKATTP